MPTHNRPCFYHPGAVHFKARHFELPLPMRAGLREVNYFPKATQSLSEGQESSQFLGCMTPGPVGGHKALSFAPKVLYLCLSGKRLPKGTDIAVPFQ